MIRLICGAALLALLAIGCGQGVKESKPTVAPGANLEPGADQTLKPSSSGGTAVPSEK